MHIQTNKTVAGLLIALVCSLNACAFEGEEGDSQDDEELTELEATAHLTGWHTICADSLTFHHANYDEYLRRGDQFYIDHFGDGYNHAWGWAYDIWGGYLGWGWVQNGWFC